MVVSEGSISRNKDARGLVCLLLFSTLAPWWVGAAPTNKFEWHSFKGTKNAKTIALCKRGAMGRCRRWRKKIFSMYALIMKSLQLSNCIFVLISSDLIEFSFVQSKHVQQTLFIQLQLAVCFFPISRALGCVVRVSRNKGVRGLLLFHYFPCLPFVVWL